MILYIKELAEEFHVSKQAIRKRLSADFRANHVQTITRNGVQTLVVNETVLVLDPISLGILGFSPLLLSVIGKNNSNGELKLNSNYYNSPNE
ncbi:hypothetical protein, partial [Enterococcus cecorum]|uniref:hypothetical protein n=1 Tax=Enterococcus cecorum TaxID=44008 RepID=UPI001E418DFA